MTGEATRCSAEVREPGQWPRYHQCRRMATVQEGGQMYCSTHSPAKVAEREQKAAAKWRERNEFERGKYEAPALRAEVARLTRERDAAISAALLASGFCEIAGYGNISDSVRQTIHLIETGAIHRED